jgi:translation elongation factor EF-4
MLKQVPVVTARDYVENAHHYTHAQVVLSITCAPNHVGDVTLACQRRHATFLSLTHIDTDTVLLTFRIALANAVFDLRSHLASITHGYASAYVYLPA